MSMEKWQTLSRSELQELAQKKGIVGVSRMTKDALIAALARHAKAKAKVKQKAAKSKTSARPRPQLHAASHGNGVSLEDQIGRSKYDFGVPTKDLSAKIPKVLPKGYGK